MPVWVLHSRPLRRERPDTSFGILARGAEMYVGLSDHHRNHSAETVDDNKIVIATESWLHLMPSPLLSNRSMPAMDSMARHKGRSTPNCIDTNDLGKFNTDHAHSLGHPEGRTKERGGSQGIVLLPLQAEGTLRISKGSYRVAPYRRLRVGRRHTWAVDQAT